MLIEEDTPIRRPLRDRSGRPGRLSRQWLWALFFIWITSQLGGIGCAGDPDLPNGSTTRVAVVANRSDPASLRIATHYARTKHLARSHVILLHLPREEHVTRRAFTDRILRPLSKWWQSLPPGDRPSYLVLTRGVPFGIRGSGGFDGTHSSVDSELTLLPRWARGDSVRLEGRIRNPYFAPLHEPGYPEDPLTENLVLVTRLTGFSEAAAMGLVSRSERATAEAMVPNTSVLILLDQRAGNSDLGERSLRRAAERVEALGATVIFDSTAAFQTRAPAALMGYASWGSNDSHYRRSSSLRWRPGAIATTFVSSSARTFLPPPDDWRPGSSRKKEHRFGGSTQSLIGDLVASGVTGAIGNVYEPYLDACARPDLLFAAYLSGRNLAEAAYLSIPFLSWQTVVIGDPLCAPFSLP